jgi:hypothetical protein
MIALPQNEKKEMPFWVLCQGPRKVEQGPKTNRLWQTEGIALIRVPHLRSAIGDYLQTEGKSCHIREKQRGTEEGLRERVEQVTLRNAFWCLGFSQPVPLMTYCGHKCCLPFQCGVRLVQVLGFDPQHHKKARIGMWVSHRKRDWRRISRADFSYPLKALLQQLSLFHICHFMICHWLRTQCKNF